MMVLFQVTYAAILILGDIKEDVVRQDHFGGNFDAESDNENDANNPERQKTKSEVMSELISKSKMYKHERQQQHDEDLDEIEALDADLGELQGLLRSVKPVRQERPARTQEMMSYDAALREMVYDKRSKPTERTKTEEEIAQEEMERLQKLEEERSKRMRGELTGVEEGGDKNRPRREGDDLDDDFVPDEQEADFYGLGKGALTEKAEASADEEDGEEQAENDNDEKEDDEDGSDDGFDLARYFTDEEDEIDNPEDDEEDEESEIIPATKRLRLAESSSSQKELAYTFPCPSTFDQLLDILKDVPVSSIPTVIERIEILHSTKLLMENREKLEVLTLLYFTNVDLYAYRSQTYTASCFRRSRIIQNHRRNHRSTT
jgi:nucleolar protein 14